MLRGSLLGWPQLQRNPPAEVPRRCLLARTSSLPPSPRLCCAVPAWLPHYNPRCCYSVSVI